MKAPIVTPTGCPRCGVISLPSGVPCLLCILSAHDRHVQLHAEEGRRAGLRPPVMSLHELHAREARRGAAVLLDHLGVLLVRVGFELPDVVEVRR